VLHIVGTPSTTQHSKRPLLHHTLGDGRYDAYSKAAAQFTVLNVDLNNKETAAGLIDQAITTCMTKVSGKRLRIEDMLTLLDLQMRPVYLTIPTDMVTAQISSERLAIPLSRLQPPNDPQSEDFVLDEIEDKVKEANGDVVVIVDACVVRFDVRNEVTHFLKHTGFPVYATPMGKTAVDENYKRYGGVRCPVILLLYQADTPCLKIYVGSITDPTIKEHVEKAKLILSIGSLQSDFNSGNFSYNIPTRRHIEVR